MRTPKKTSWFTKYDKISYGLMAGVLSTLIGFFLNYFINSYLFSSLFRHWDIYRKVDYEILSDMMTLALLAPMAIFYFTFFRNDYQHFSRGLLLTILPLVIFIIAISV